jgi:serine phosphatase RsbU (regulator of sigma subunit)
MPTKLSASKVAYRHGVPGAFMTMIATTSLKRIVEGEHCHEPSEILKRLNVMVKTALQQDTQFSQSDDGLDAAICFIRFSDNILLFSGAKLPLIYIKNQQATLVKGNRQSIGYKRSDVHFEFTTHVIPIEVDMACYLFTDGFIDQLGGPKRLPLGHKRFTDLLSRIQSQSFSEQSRMLVEVFQDYQGNNDRQDDVTVVGFKL